jgi:tellurite resistance protein TerC
MHVSPLVWWLTIVIAVVVLFVDLVVVGRRPHEPSRREGGVALGLFVGLAVAFGVVVWALSGQRYGTEFFAGWITEYSLSVDNLFVFLLIMGRFGVPRPLQQSALLVGIVTALVLRGVFIALGAAAIEHVSWIFFVFGLFLLWTAVSVAREGAADEPEGHDEGRLVRWIAAQVRSTDEWHGARLFVRSHGRRLVTPMFLVVLALGTTDLLFALDSIPAIYGLTEEPYLVFTANVFALMGLRQLYFLVGDLLQRLVFLSYGLAVLLAFIGVKLVLHALHANSLPFLNGGRPVAWAPDIPIWLSLAVIVGVLLVTAVASLLVDRVRGRVTGAS